MVFYLFVVSYWNSTSNHNWDYVLFSELKVVSYWNSTSNHNIHLVRKGIILLYLIEILHQTTTTTSISWIRISLYLIEILHQTTTSVQRYKATLWLYLIEILHQTTTLTLFYINLQCCILLKFYIKPQQLGRSQSYYFVVSYWNSTSNHNRSWWDRPSPPVVSYWNSTSNHN